MSDEIVQIFCPHNGPDAVKQGTVYIQLGDHKHKLALCPQCKLAVVRWASPMPIFGDDTIMIKPEYGAVLPEPVWIQDRVYLFKPDKVLRVPTEADYRQAAIDRSKAKGNRWWTRLANFLGKFW